MLRYAPGTTVAHRLDPRSKLAFQVGFAIAAFGGAGVGRLAGLYGLTAVVLAAGRLSPRRVVREYGVVLAVLALAPVIAGIALGPPWFRVDDAVRSLHAVARVPPVLAVSAVYIATTPIRETRAAIERVVPGRPGQLIAVGVSLVVRFFPLVVDDLRTVRAAIHARGGERRPVTDRAQRLAVRGLDRALARSDRLAVALRARCFAWNPTLPPLALSGLDYPVLAASVLLALLPLIQSAAWLPLLAVA